MKKLDYVQKCVNWSIISQRGIATETETNKRTKQQTADLIKVSLQFYLIFVSLTRSLLWGRREHPTETSTLRFCVFALSHLCYWCDWEYHLFQTIWLQPSLSLQLHLLWAQFQVHYHWKVNGVNIFILIYFFLITSCFHCNYYQRQYFHHLSLHIPDNQFPVSWNHNELQFLYSSSLFVLRLLTANKTFLSWPARLHWEVSASLSSHHRTLSLSLSLPALSITQTEQSSQCNDGILNISMLTRNCLFYQ